MVHQVHQAATFLTSVREHDHHRHTPCSYMSAQRGAFGVHCCITPSFCAAQHLTCACKQTYTMHNNVIVCMHLSPSSACCPHADAPGGCHFRFPVLLFARADVSKKYAPASVRSLGCMHYRLVHAVHLRTHATNQVQLRLPLWSCARSVFVHHVIAPSVIPQQQSLLTAHVHFSLNTQDTAHNGHVRQHIQCSRARLQEAHCLHLYADLLTQIHLQSGCMLRCAAWCRNQPEAARRPHTGPAPPSGCKTAQR